MLKVIGILKHLLIGQVVILDHLQMTGSKYLILEENCTHHFLTHRSVLNRSGGISGIAIKGDFNLYPGSCRL